ncbi:MAG: LLM class flavin-dependent oxidoreductase [Candidatus Dormibacterales bacterium]
MALGRSRRRGAFVPGRRPRSNGQTQGREASIAPILETNDPTRLGIGFLGQPDLRSMIEAGRASELAGFESAWVAETRLTRDAVTGVTALLLNTERMRVGSSAINVFTRGAALIAVTWATLSEAAPGRVVLGIGAGSAGPLRQQGFEADHPVSRLRELTEAVRAAWAARAPITRVGNHVSFDDLLLEVRPAPTPDIYFCVGGPRALALAGEIADGVVLDAFLPPAAARQARAILDSAQPGSGFKGELAGAVMVSVADSRAEAAAALRPVLAGYLVNFPELARVSGVDPELTERLRELAASDGMEAASRLLSDDLVAAHAVCGPPGACRERVAEYRAAGYDLPILFPVRGSLMPCIDLLAGA